MNLLVPKPVGWIFAILIVLILQDQSAADMIFELKGDSLVRTGANSYSITAVLRLNNDTTNDLSSPPRLSSVNIGVAFDPADTGLEFVDISPPSNGELFVANRTYSSGSPDLTRQLFGSVISNVGGGDPLAINGARLFNINFTASASVVGTHTLILDPLSTFYTVNGGGGNPVAFSALPATASFTISAVPEPSTTFLLATASMAYIGWRRRCRKSNHSPT